MNKIKIKNSLNYCMSNLIYVKGKIIDNKKIPLDSLQVSKNNPNDIFMETTFLEDGLAEEIIDVVQQLRLELDVPSIQVSILSKDYGKFDYVSGYASLEEKKLATLNTVYYLGSITKIYMQAIILKLVQDNKISLDDSISKYLKELTNHKEVTIKHLLNHTSGLYDPLLNKVHLFKLYFLGKKSTTDEILKKVKEKKPFFTPDADRKYCNTGYVLLGLIAEKVTNKPFSSILKEYFLDEYELHETFYSAQDNIPNIIATGYDLDKYLLKKGLKANIDRFPLFLPTLSFTSGGIVSNASNVSRFLFNIFNTNILDDKSKRKLRLFFSVKNISNVVLRINIGHMCGYNNFSGYSDSKKFSIVVLTNLTYSSSGICIPEIIAERIIDTMAKKNVI